eukprot:4314950-Pleurochrysis_carterae.AAC.1
MLVHESVLVQLAHSEKRAPLGARTHVSVRRSVRTCMIVCARSCTCERACQHERNDASPLHDAHELLRGTLVLVGTHE